MDPNDPNEEELDFESLEAADLPNLEFDGAPEPLESPDPAPVSLDPGGAAPFDPDLADIGGVTEGDDKVLRKMGRGFSTVGTIVGVSLVVGAIVLGVFYYRRSQAREHRFDFWETAQAADSREEFLRMIREELARTEFADVKVRILNKMAEYRDAASVDAIIAELDGPPTVQIAAARALAAIGSPEADRAKPRLLAMVGADTPETVKAPVVWALTVLGASEAAPHIIHQFTQGHLQHQEGFDPRMVANVLGIERLTSEELTGHPEVSVRTLVAQTLAETASPEIIPALSRMVDQELERDEPDQNVMRAIASGLGRAGDSRSGPPLFRILERQPRLRAPVLDALRSSVGANGIAALLGSAEDVGIKRDLTRMLRDSHDPRGADAMASLLDSTDSDIKQDAAFGLSELGDARAVPVLIELSRHEDLAVGRDALDHLRRLGSDQAVDGLIEMLDAEQYYGRRAAVLRALGTSGSVAAGPAIQRFLEGDDVGSAAAALADLNYEPAYTTLLHMIPRPRDVDFSTPRVSNEEAFTRRTAAVRAIGRYGRADAAESLMTIIEDPLDDRRLRLDAGFALGSVADAETLRTIIGKARDTSVDEVARRYYTASLWQRPDPATTPLLLEMIADTEVPPDVRRGAALALGYSADPEADARLLEMLGQEATQREAAFAISLGGSEANAQALLTALGTNLELRGFLQDAYLNQENDYFNLVIERHFESGQVYRRLRAAQILNNGEGDNRHGYCWQQYVNRLKAGWGGTHGLTPRDIRTHLWDALRGEDAPRRALVAEALGAMNERGMLMAARDLGGDGSEEARAELRRLNTPTQQQGAEE